MTKLKTCFIASTIGEENSEERKNADDKFDLVFKSILDELGYESIRADKIGTPNSISNDIVKSILESDLMIADVSDLNPNVFYELAVRNSIQKPVIVIKGKSQKMPFDIYDKRAISLDMKDARLWTTAKESLKNQIYQSEKDKVSASKSILSNFVLKTDLKSEINSRDELPLEIKDLKSEIRRLREDVREKNQSPQLADFIYNEYNPSPKEFMMMQLFMDVLKSLEGERFKPVSREILIEELVKTEKFSHFTASKYIKKNMINASIYESKPRHYNHI